jgi:8-oxo-dGTP pyrophosphatase MutT (NUDIX family)
MNASTNTPAVPRASASLCVVRAAAGGVEILLLKRADKGDQNSGAWVFPGGLIDAGDADCRTFCEDPDDARASSRLGLACNGLDYYIAAIRECFEESGLLFAVGPAGCCVAVDSECGAAVAPLRVPLARGERAFADICRTQALRLANGQLHYIAHWITPLVMPKRFDTRFFLAVLPEGQSSAHDAVEAVEHAWLTPAELLAPTNTRRLLNVTRTLITTVGEFADLDALLAWARSPREVTTVLGKRPTDK